MILEQILLRLGWLICCFSGKIFVMLSWTHIPLAIQSIIRYSIVLGSISKTYYCEIGLFFLIALLQLNVSDDCSVSFDVVNNSVALFH
jgi:hypothetical protein